VTNDKHDRDAGIDRLLAGAMPRGSEEPAGACLDADTLAAWADEALDASELAAAEAHAADCARCQAMLAAMVKTAPATPVTATFPWRLTSLRWLVPVTAAAAAVFLWTIVPLRDGPANVRQVSQSAESIPSPPSRTQPASPAPATDAVAPPSAAAVDERTRGEQQTPAEAKDLEADKKNAASADAHIVLDAPARGADGRLEKRQAAAEVAAAAPTEAPASAPAAKTFSFGAPETVIVSSNPASRWRILQGGAVQRSSDAGATWQTQNTGVSQTLSAGASPSPSVCWLVGPGGIVLLSTDGRSWKRLAFPEAVPLAAIRAADAETATVTTADGREFVTDDGGRTWTRV
jgi:hypothetical protein